MFARPSAVSAISAVSSLVGGVVEVSFTYICHAEEALLREQTPFSSPYVHNAGRVSRGVVVEEAFSLMGAGLVGKELC